MNFPARPTAPPPVTTAELERLLDAVESSLQALGLALRSHDADALAAHAQGLHRALAPTVDQFSRAARQGRLPGGLRQRLVHVGREVAAQRLAMGPQQRALDRALQTLMPGEAAAAAASAYRI